MGLSNDDYLFFKDQFTRAGVLDKIVCFVNTSEDPPIERLLIPEMACTAAEYFAYRQNQNLAIIRLKSPGQMKPQKYPDPGIPASKTAMYIILLLKLRSRKYHCLWLESLTELLRVKAGGQVRGMCPLFRLMVRGPYPHYQEERVRGAPRHYREARAKVKACLLLPGGAGMASSLQRV